MQDSDLELGRFAEFLLKSRIVPEKYARYYVAWVRKFLCAVRRRGHVSTFYNYPAPPSSFALHIARQL